MGHSLISANRVEGTAVFGKGDERLGHIEEVMIDKASGKVAYAVMSYGGVMGVGERYHPLPWSLLRYDTDKNGYVVAIDRAQLEGGVFLDGKAAGQDDSAWRDSVHDYYNAQPYWFTGGLI